MRFFPCRLLALLSCVFAAALIIPLVHTAGAQTITDKPEITDMTTGVPVTGSNFTINVRVTDADGISYVRLYLWFRVPAPLNVTPTQYIIMDTSLPTPNGPDYESTFEVPEDASTLNYYVTAYDNLYTSAPIDEKQNHVNSTDMISRQVRDNVPPVASCAQFIDVEMGLPVTFDGSASTDNVAVTNFTWAFSYDGSQIRRYGIRPAFTFAIPGEYPGTLTVKDAWNNQAVKAFQVNVTDTEPPVADAGAYMFIAAGNVTYLDGYGSTDNVGIVNYTWTYIQNGTLVTLYGETISVTFWTPGLYNVTLTVMDAAGNTDSAIVQVQAFQSDTGGEGLAWWIYALIIIIIFIIAATVYVLRS